MIRKYIFSVGLDVFYKMGVGNGSVKILARDQPYPISALELEAPVSVDGERINVSLEDSISDDRSYWPTLKYRDNQRRILIELVDEIKKLITHSRIDSGSEKIIHLQKKISLKCTNGLSFVEDDGNTPTKREYRYALPGMMRINPKRFI